MTEITTSTTSATSVFNSLKLALELLVYISAIAASFLGVYLASPKVKKFFDRNIEIKYKKVYFLKEYKFTMFLLNLLCFSIFWFISYGLFLLFKMFYEYMIYSLAIYSNLLTDNSLQPPYE